MSRGRLTITVLFAVLAVTLVAYFTWSNSGEKRFQWYENYDAESSQPYGTLFLRQMLEDYRGNGSVVYSDKKPVHEFLDSTIYQRNTDYVFVGQSNYLDHQDVDALARFMSRGNNVFIASLTPPEDLVARIYSSDCSRDFDYTTERITTVGMNFYHDTLKAKKSYKYSFRFAGIDRPYHWRFLDRYVLCDSTVSIVPLGHLDGNVVNFLKIPYAGGALYLHTNPIAFTNYFLTKKDKLEYVSGVFSHLDGRDIIWDEYSKLPFAQDTNQYNSPLYFIMQQPSLKYAWWMMLAAVALFVFFYARRRQRIIPVLEEKSNTSLEFVSMISSLYFQNGDHLDMARKKMKYFLYFIRAKYGVHTASLTQAHVPLLAEKSKVKEGDVQQIYDRWNVIDRFAGTNVEPERLVDLYYAIDTFYRKCK